MAPRPRASSDATEVALFLVIVACLGASAWFLLGPTTQSSLGGTSGGTTATGLAVQLPTAFWGILLLSPLLVLFITLAVSLAFAERGRRSARGRADRPGRVDPAGYPSGEPYLGLRALLAVAIAIAILLAIVLLQTHWTSDGVFRLGSPATGGASCSGNNCGGTGSGNGGGGGSGTGGGTGAGGGTGTGTGNGTGTGGGTGSGTGGGTGNGTGGGTGNGTGGGVGNGTGGGTGNGTGSGSGSGSGSGNGSGTKNGTGGGTGNGTGSGSGSGSGSGNGSGTKNGTGSTNGTTNGTGSANGTTNGTGSTNRSSGHNSTGGASSPFRPLSGFRFTIPVWVVLVLAAIGCGAAALLAMPKFVFRRRKGPAPLRGGPGGSPAADGGSGIRAALAQAEAALKRKDDPREAIVRLYGQLLVELAPRVGDVGPSTAEEIRRGPLQRLGVRAGAAVALTRLFEAARYSTHPMGAQAAHEFGDAVRIARSDLLRAGTAG